MKQIQVTMVNPQQIAQRGLKGCKTVRQVTTFAQKHNVPWTWYKPTPNYKVMLVDWPGFRTAWKENSTCTTKNQTNCMNKKNTTNNNNNYATRTTMRTRTANSGTKRYATNYSETPKTTFKNAYRKPTTKTTYGTTKTSYRTYSGQTRTKRAA